MSGYKIRKKWSSMCDSEYVDSFGNKCDSFFAKEFSSKEDAERNKESLTWHHNSFQSDWEIVKD